MGKIYEALARLNLTRQDSHQIFSFAILPLIFKTLRAISLKFVNLNGALISLFAFYSLAFGEANPKIILVNENLLGAAVSEKISNLGDELFEKSGILVGVAAFENLSGKTLQAAFNELNLHAPYAVLMLTKNEHKVEIFADEATAKLFNKEQILSPFPNAGSILPILTSKNGKDIYNAALLNGYADIAEQIAASKGITLANAIGSQNRAFLDILRIFVYGSIALVILSMLVRKFRRKNG